jgi:hypothetical protein
MVLEARRPFPIGGVLDFLRSVLIAALLLTAAGPVRGAGISLPPG